MSAPTHSAPAQPGGPETDTLGVRLTGVTKRYGDKAVVDDISIDIRRGEFVTFLGPSGSGKTTTLSMIAGFTQVSNGNIEIHDRSVATVPPHKRDIGMVFQNYALFPHRTVAGNVAFPLERRKIAKAERARMVREALEMVHMTDYADRTPSELSGGQQQRVALARALVYNPAVLLMDEPLGALDKKLRDWLQSEIKRIHLEVQSTFLYVTHDQEEALSLSDRIAVFNNGRIEQLGTPQELYESPSTLFVGTFVGDSTLVRGASFAAAGGLSAGRTVGPQGLSRVTEASAAALIRPEKLALLPADSALPDGSCGIQVTVRTATYLGNAWRYELSLPDGSTGMAKTESEAPGAVPGATMLAVWHPSDAVILSDDGGSGEFLT
ncbi:ABC transporter ATP-binding protein [Leucobacter luti]|uniref:ABC-type quaternary amine transporter n=1 Tax=Leucobacter luti TaxID=340320 RepID=A0A4Q7TG72_9MICO|nr:ABC transporter ATP-binding protein [Leucobacter luti]MBL3699688.1 ABC transporter ATP-binding protein [Leucobacter luti]RZT59464.1 putative spermidine/putrescine transport system ATP-binding protein [Leucobacter luti]